MLDVLSALKFDALKIKIPRQGATGREVLVHSERQPHEPFPYGARDLAVAYCQRPTRHPLPDRMAAAYFPDEEA